MTVIGTTYPPMSDNVITRLFERMEGIRANWRFTPTGSCPAFSYSPTSVEKNLILLEGSKDCSVGIGGFSHPRPLFNLPRLVRATGAKSMSCSVTSAIGTERSYAIQKAMRPRDPEHCSMPATNARAASQSVVITNNIITIDQNPKRTICIHRGGCDLQCVQ